MTQHAVTSADDALALASAPKRRAVYAFKVPENLATEFVAFQMVELETGEELMAAKRAQQDPILLGFELAKAALYGVKRLKPGQAFPKPAELKAMPWTRVTTGDLSAEEAYSAMHPRVRQLVMTAYARLHNNTGEDQKSFLASMEVSIE